MIAKASRSLLKYNFRSTKKLSKYCKGQQIFIYFVGLLIVGVYLTPNDK